MAQTQCKRDVYAEIVDSIISQLEKGCAPWRQPWRTDVAAEGNHVPHNAATGRRYNGINVLQLWAVAAAQGYASHGWLTFKQARELGGTVRKGETGTPVVYWSPKERRTVNDAGEEETSRYLMLRYFTVFHVSQTEGCKLPGKPARPLPAPVDPNDAMGVVRPLLDEQSATATPQREPPEQRRGPRVGQPDRRERAAQSIRNASVWPSRQC